MLQFKNITHTRTVAVSNEVEITATSTAGEFKMTPLAAEKLNVKEGDFVAVVVLDTDVYLAKGKSGVVITDANGQPVRDSRNRLTYEEGTTYGSLARTLSEGATTIRFTSTGGWKALGASEETVQVYGLSEGVEGQVPVSNERDAELYTATFYKLELKDIKAKAKRVKAESDVNADDIEVNATATEEEAEEAAYDFEN